jgi:hypothetical protein
MLKLASACRYGLRRRWRHPRLQGSASSVSSPDSASILSGLNFLLTRLSMLCLTRG